MFEKFALSVQNDIDFGFKNIVSVSEFLLAHKIEMLVCFFTVFRHSIGCCKMKEKNCIRKKSYKYRLCQVDQIRKKV